MRTLKVLVSLAMAAHLLVAAGKASGIPAAPNATASLAAPRGEVYTHEAGGVQFELPKGWKAEPDGEQITVSPADDSIGMVLWVASENTFEAAVEALGDELEKQIKNPKLDGDGEPKEDTHNGMPHVSLSGSGTIEGRHALWSVDLLMAKKPVIVLTFAAPEEFKKHAADFAKLVDSIKKVS